MALTQVSTGGIKDGQIHTADLADGAISAQKLHSQARDETYTLGADGSNHYTFTGKGLTGAVNDPTLYLERGKTYRFVNNNSAGAHPFRIQTTVNGSAGTEYNTGVTNNGGAGGSTIVFEVPHAAPDTLYYQCTSHGSMGGIFYITGALADSRVTTAKLANDGVTTAKLADSNVTTAKIADAAITNGKIASDAVTNTKIQDNAITTAKIQDGNITQVKIGDQSINEAKLQVSNSPTNGYFLSAQSGNTGGLTWAQVAQPDLTNLSATNLTSGTIPDARFPATLPAAIASNLTNIPAANLTGALPAISGAALTGLASACTRVKIGYRDSHWQVPHYNTGYQDVPGTSLTFDNVTSDMRYLIYHEYSMKSYGNQQWYKCQGYFNSSGGQMRGGSSNSVSDQTGSYTQFGPYIGIDYASNTSNRTYSIKGRSSYYQHSQIGITNAFVMVMEFKVA